MRPRTTNHTSGRPPTASAGSCSPSTSARSDEVEAIYAALQGVDGVELLEEPTEAFWGGGFSWRDPEGNSWDVAWAKDARLDEGGGVWFP